MTGHAKSYNLVDVSDDIAFRVSNANRYIRVIDSWEVFPNSGLSFSFLNVKHLQYRFYAVKRSNNSEVHVLPDFPTNTFPVAAFKMVF